MSATARRSSRNLLTLLAGLALAAAGVAVGSQASERPDITHRDVSTQTSQR